MTKRESGWYRVKFHHDDEPQIVFYDAEHYCFRIVGCSDEVSGNYAEIDPQMVMTPSGQIVYNQPAHDPLYNTKQEG